MAALWLQHTAGSDRVALRLVERAHMFAVPATAIVWGLTGASGLLLAAIGYVLGLFAIFLFIRSGHRLPPLAVMDLVVVLGATLLDPDLWFPMTIAALAATSIGWLLSRRVALLLAAVSTIGVGITGFVTGADATFATTALYGVVTVTLGLTNSSLYEERTRVARRITELLDSVPVLIWEADIAESRLTYMAGHVERILGLDAAAYSSRTPTEWLHPDDLDTFEVDWDAHVEGEPLEHEVRILGGDGQWVLLRQIVRPVRVGGRLLLRGVSRDISAEQRAREAMQQYAEIGQRMHDGVIVLGHQRIDGCDTLRLQFWNRSAQNLLRLTEEHRDRRFSEVLPGIARDVARQLDSRRRGRDSEPDVVSGGEVAVTVGADARWIDYELFRVSSTAVALRISDVTVRKEAQDLLRHQATHDHLTGLLNRVALVEHLEAALAAERHMGLLLLDLDQFKEINDTLGHHYGDRVLSILARRFPRVEGVDLVARLGGDEFAFLVDDVRDLTALEQIADRVASAVEQTIGIDDLSLRVGPSIGLALAPEHGRQADELLQHADIAMYQAKRLGRRHMVYRPADDRHTLDRLALMAELPNLLLADELRMWFQPKVDLRTGRVAGVEALMRWEHPREGLLVPDRFIELLEVSAQMIETTWVALDRSLSNVAHIDPGLSIAVNIPARALLDHDAATRILDRLALAGLPPERLHLELTEREIMEDSTSVRTVLDELRAAGVRISIDDFGTGYSSLSYLRRLPVSEIKIDRAFVAGMLQNDHDFLIARAITDLGHNLGHRIVAEGVEDEATLELLRTMGCDEAQGFLFARPVPADRLAEVIRTIEDRWAVNPARPEHSARPG